MPTPHRSELGTTEAETPPGPDRPGALAVPPADPAAALGRLLESTALALRTPDAGVWLAGRAPVRVGAPAAPDPSSWAVPVEETTDAGRARLQLPVARRGGAIGAVVFERPAPAPWTAAERLAAGAVADRAVLQLEESEREAAEAALVRWRLQIDELERLAQAGSWEWDPAADRIAWSREQLRIHGLDESTAPRDLNDFLRFVHPDDLARVTAETLRLSATGEPFSLDYRIVRPDGSLRQLTATGQMLTGADGARARMVGISRDVTEQREAETALSASEESYRTIFEFSNDAIFVHDMESGAILDANRQACMLTGATLEELRSSGMKRISDGPSPYTLDAARERVRLAARGEPQCFEWLSGYDAAGEENWVEVSLQRVAIRGEDRVLALVRDIRDRKLAEARLLRINEELERRVDERTHELAATNEALEEEVAEHEAAKEELLERTRELEGIFRALPDRYFRLDDEGRILDYRAGSAASIVRPPRALIGRLLADVLPGEGPKRLAEALAEVARTRRLVLVEYSVEIGRHSRDFEARVLPLEDGTRIMVVRDITVRKNAERALREREEHFRKLIENTSDIITILELDGTVRYQSPAIERLLGYTHDALDGHSIFDFVHPDDHAETRAVFREVVGAPGSSRTLSYRFRHADGSWRVLESTGRTIHPTSGEEGVVINSRDVTERALAEAALARAKEEAERANRAKSEFLSRMSHELRTPMNSILGFAQLLARAELLPQQAKSVQHILRAGRHLLHLINEVLEIARIEAGRQNFSLEPVGVGAVLAEAMGLVRPLAAQWAVELEEGPGMEEEIFVRADRQRLVQVLLNLLSNAIKYNQPGGRVQLSFSSTRDGGRVQVRVTDTGHGIPADRADQLFTPFARLGAEQTEVEGTGLGLALSQRLCEAMGGSLVLEESGEAGSTFRIELIRATDPVAELEDAPAPPVPPADAEQREAVLLYVEDNLANLTLVETILLSRPAWRTVPALQGQLGVELAREHRPDLILLDLHLPDISGEEVLRRLRADERTASIPVVIISADATPASLARLSAAGADAYLTKPLDVDDFLATVDRFLEEAKR